MTKEFESVRRKNYSHSFLCANPKLQQTKSPLGECITHLDKKANKKGDEERQQSSMGYRYWKT